jgi:hypothetical protein
MTNHNSYLTELTLPFVLEKQAQEWHILSLKIYLLLEADSSELLLIKEDQKQKIKRKK